jgi:hypothetical protein
MMLEDAAEVSDAYIPFDVRGGGIEDRLGLYYARIVDQYGGRSKLRLSV